ncbi:MAG: YqgE/AlgH family protein [Pirellulaceae bacterium]|nr:YqgE/AlgH family protein [Pirellulaceae bacterium]
MSNRIPSSDAQLVLRGQLLVATNRCADHILQGSVCLILHHDGEGSMGLVLNRSIETEVGGLWKFLKASKEQESRPIRFGGPISGPILALHNQQECAEMAAASGVYLAAHVDKLQKLVSSSSGEVRIVVGQVLWKEGQLEQEIVDRKWLPVPATPDLVFAPEEEMWRKSMLVVGNRFVKTLVGAVQPAHVGLN